MMALGSVGDWDWVAIGTLLLALATFSLALYNRKIVTTSQAQLETARQDLVLAREQNGTARESLESQTAPLLASVPWGLEKEAVKFLAETGEPQRFRDASRVTVSHGAVGNEERVLISVPFRNVGNGVAIITSIQVMIGGQLFDGAPRAPILPPGEFARAGVEAGRSDPIFEYAISLAVDGRDFAIVLGYADAAGNSRGALRLDLHCEAAGRDRWRVRQLHIGDTPDAALNQPKLSSLPL